MSDGVIAVAITILVLDLKLPAHAVLNTSDALWLALKQNGMQVLAYLISFVVIAKYWMAHYATFNRLEEVSDSIIGVNIVFLLTITFIPFPVSVFAHSNTALATIFYNVSLILPSLVLAYLNLKIANNISELFPEIKKASEKKKFKDRYYKNILNSGPVIVVGIISSIICLFNNDLGGYAWALLMFSKNIMSILNKSLYLVN
jgi:uncharacterized membrane protein